MARLHRAAAVAVTVVVLLASLAGPAAAAAPGYVVQPGDTLFRISVRFGVSMDAIRSANGFTGDRIYAGQNLIIPDGSTPVTPPTDNGGANSGESIIHVVQAGETLFTIGLKYGLVWTKIAAANNIVGTSIYSGQRLVIPVGGEPTAPPTNSDSPTAPPDNGSQTPPPQPATGSTVHIVQRGETLHKIGLIYGVPWPAIQQANNLPNTTIWVGQQLIIPPSSGVTAPPAEAPAGGSFEGRYFLVDLSEQRLYAFEGSTMVRTTLISSGLSATPTVVGTFHIYARYVSTRMRGPGYDLPNVPYTMYFFEGYGLHGTYWHNNFGTPMSHGCVNMPTPEAEWAYNWSTYGTPVIVQY